MTDIELAYRRGFEKVASLNGVDSQLLAVYALERNKQADYTPLTATKSPIIKNPARRRTATTAPTTAPNAAIPPASHMPLDTGEPDFTENKPVAQTPVAPPAPATPVATAVSNTQQTVRQTAQRATPTASAQTNQAPKVDPNSPYGRFAAKARSSNWTMENGMWVSPSGKRYSVQDVQNRMNERAALNKFNQNAAARHAAVGYGTPTETESATARRVANMTRQEDRALEGANTNLNKVNATINGQQVQSYTGTDGRPVFVQSSPSSSNRWGHSVSSVRPSSTRSSGIPVFIGGKRYLYQNGRLLLAGSGNSMIGGRPFDRFGNMIQPTYKHRRLY